MTLARALAEWAVALEPDSLPASVTAAVRRHVLDGLGCALAAARRGAADPVMSAVGRDGPGPCPVPGTALRLPAPAAALATGTLVHALDFDDTHAGGLVHPTAPVLAAALSAATEHTDATKHGDDGEAGADGDGARFAAAVAVGLEVVCRLGAAVRHGFHARGFHATSVCGAPAAALVAARLAGCDAAVSAHAVGIAVSFASGSLEFLADGSSTKQLHPGWAAHAGIMAARLAMAGATGPTTALEGERGLFTAFTGQHVEAADVLEGLGARWEATRITIKPYPACQLLHADLDALATVRPDLDGDEVRELRFAVHPDAVDVVCEPAAAKRRPRSGYDAKFSLPFTAAALLVDGAVTVDTFGDDERLRRSDVLAVADRVRFEVTGGDVPAADAPGAVEIRTTGGRSLSGHVPASRGGPERPLDDADLAAKLRGNVGDDALAAALTDAVGGRDGWPDLHTLGQLLSTTPEE